MRQLFQVQTNQQVNTDEPKNRVVHTHSSVHKYLGFCVYWLFTQEGSLRIHPGITEQTFEGVVSTLKMSIVSRKT